MHYADYPCLVEGCTRPTHEIRWGDLVCDGFGICDAHEAELYPRPERMQAALDDFLRRESGLPPDHERLAAAVRAIPAPVRWYFQLSEALRQRRLKRTREAD